MSFSLTDLVQCKQKLGQFSKNPSKFVEEFHVLRLVYDLTWKDVRVVLSTCLYPWGKMENLEAAQGQADQLAKDQPEHYVMGEEAVLNQETFWNFFFPETVYFPSTEFSF